jgi:hypothetical protein
VKADSNARFVERAVALARLLDRGQFKSIFMLRERDRRLIELVRLTYRPE